MYLSLASSALERSPLAPMTWSIPSVLTSAFGTNKDTILVLVLMNLDKNV